MQYRIVKRIDSILDRYYFHVERRIHEENNWIQIGYQCTTFESALSLLQSYKDEEVVYVE